VNELVKSIAMVHVRLSVPVSISGSDRPWKRSCQIMLGIGTSMYPHRLGICCHILDVSTSHMVLVCAMISYIQVEPKDGVLVAANLESAQRENKFVMSMVSPALTVYIQHMKQPMCVLLGVHS
jgi:hypothetical protein